MRKKGEENKTINKRKEATKKNRIDEEGKKVREKEPLGKDKGRSELSQISASSSSQTRCTVRGL